MPERKPLVAGDGDPRHGTSNAYNWHRCRCDICRVAESTRGAERRSKNPKNALGPGDKRHGTSSGYNWYKCRCDICKAEEAKRSALRKLTQTGLPPGDSRHGTPNGYKWHKCRCDLCRAANNEEQRLRRKKDTETLPVVHGTKSRYSMGCRCDLCREANRVYMAEYREQRKQLERRRARNSSAA